MQPESCGFLLGASYVVFIGRVKSSKGEQTEARLAQRRYSDVKQVDRSRDKRTKRRRERAGTSWIFKTNESWNAAVCLGARTISWGEGKQAVARLRGLGERWAWLANLITRAGREI